nr:FecR domain-containing protein [Azomonas macrocytogenes]
MEQAADWQLRLLEDSSARPAFERWLIANPANAAAWQQIERVWGGLGQLAQASPSTSESPASERQIAPPPPHRRTRRFWQSLALAASLAAFAFLSYPRLLLHWQADYLTGVAETAELHLADGSSVVLGPRSAFSSNFSNGRREIILLEGEAFFDVMHDLQRPFVVRSGTYSVRVLGTAFEIKDVGAHLDVAVQRGQVVVEGRNVSEKLLPGERLSVQRSAGQTERQRIPIEQVAAWRQGLLFVENAPVTDILTQLQRYTPGWIFLGDSSLGERRISGVFDLNHPDRALAGLAQSLSVNHRQITPWVRIVGNR